MNLYHAVDQYGDVVAYRAEDPRVGLLEELGATRAQNMYVDGKDGKAYHIGYIVKKRWFSIFKLEAMREPA